MSDENDSGSFLNRWSARKQQSARTVMDDIAAPEADAVPADPAAPADSTARLPEGLLQQDLSGTDLNPAEPGAAEARSTIELQDLDSVPVEQAQTLLTDADMPAIETLTASSDISGFLSQGVSAALRKAALRHVFRQPSYNVRDGLDDYDDDYTVFEPLGDTVTSDMKFHAARHQRAKLESERLAQIQAERELDMPESAESEEHDASTIESEQGDTSANEPEPVDTSTNESERNDVSTIESEQAGEPAEQNTVADHQAAPEPGQDTPQNKTPRATTPRSSETANE